MLALGRFEHFAVPFDEKIFTGAASERPVHRALRGAVLSLVYCFGLGLPFVLLAVAFSRMARAIGWVRRHYVWVMRIGGGMLVLVGILL